MATQLPRARSRINAENAEGYATLSRESMLKAIHALRRANAKLRVERDLAVDHFHDNKETKACNRKIYNGPSGEDWKNFFWVIEKIREFYPEDRETLDKIETFEIFAKEHRKVYSNGYVASGLPKLDYKELTAEQAADLRLEAMEITRDYFLSQGLGDPCE